jgi:uncharacterized protein (PEP-CTERM system associated)
MRSARPGGGEVAWGVVFAGFLVGPIGTATAQPAYAPPAAAPAPNAAPAAPGAAPEAPAAAAPAPNAPATVYVPAILPSIEVDESFNDNVNLTARGTKAQADFITSISPSLAVNENGSRLKFNLIYDPQENFYVGDNSTQILQQRLTTSGEATIVRDTLFFDERAAIDQQYLGIGNGAVSTTTLTTNNNLQTVSTYTLSPILRHRFGSIVSSETTYNFGEVYTSGNTLAPVRTNEFKQVFTSADYFGRLGWTLTGDLTKTDTGFNVNDAQSNTSDRDELLRGDLRYLIQSGVTALASLGYEKITDPTLASPTNGPLWDVGAQYQPNQDLTTTLTYGQRYGGPDIEFSANYNITAALHFNASYGETLETSQAQLANNLPQLVFINGIPVNSQTGLPFTGAINPVTGLPLTPLNVSNSAALIKNFQATLTAIRERNTYTVTAYYDTQTTEIPPSSQRTWGGSVAWSRDLQPSLKGNLTATYSHSSLGNTGSITDVYSMTAGLTYTLSQTATLNFNLQRSSQTGTLPGNDVDDDIVALIFRKQF